MANQSRSECKAGVFDPNLIFHSSHACLQDLVSNAVAANQDVAEGALTAVLVWLRFSSSRLLTWNKNYNIKPREISAAQVCPGHALLPSDC